MTTTMILGLLQGKAVLHLFSIIEKRQTYANASCTWKKWGTDKVKMTI